MKPKVLYHGSTQYKSYLAPSQGIGDGHNDHHMAVYAIADVEIARFLHFNILHKLPRLVLKLTIKMVKLAYFCTKLTLIGSTSAISILYPVSTLLNLKMNNGFQILLCRH